MDYSQREIVDVHIGDIRTGINQAGDTLAVGLVTLELHNEFYPAHGPTVTARMGVFLGDGAPIGEIELQLLNGAHDLLKRFAAEPLEALQDVYFRKRDERSEPDPLAEFPE
jgi:hypothetical protein